MFSVLVGNKRYPEKQGQKNEADAKQVSANRVKPNQNIFNPIPSDQVKATSQDILIILVSDKNPLFNEASLRAVVKQAKASDFKLINIILTGSLQRHTVALEQVLKGQPIDYAKAEKDGLKKEEQNINRALAIATAQFAAWDEDGSIHNIQYWVLEQDKAKASTVASTDKKLQKRHDKILAELQGTLTVWGLPLLVKVNGFYDADYTTIHQLVQKSQLLGETEFRHVDSLIQLLKNYSNAIRKRKVSQVSLQLSPEELCLVDYYRKTQREIVRTGIPVVTIMPWQNFLAPVGRDVMNHPIHALHCATSEVRERIPSDEAASAKFKELVEEIVKIKLSGLAREEISAEAKSKVTRCVVCYLTEELGYFNQLIDTAIELFKLNGAVGTLYLQYPMGTEIGHYVFEFVSWLFQEKLKCYTGAFKFIDSTDDMRKSQVTNSSDLESKQAKSEDKSDQRADEVRLSKDKRASESSVGSAKMALFADLISKNVPTRHSPRARRHSL